MPEKNECDKCGGCGYIEVLVNMHDNKKETIVCDKCRGKKIIYTMTDDDERDYHADYW